MDPKGKQKVVEIVKRLVQEKLYLPHVEENPAGDDEMDSDFMDLEPDFDIICKVLSILPAVSRYFPQPHLMRSTLVDFYSWRN